MKRYLGIIAMAFGLLIEPTTGNSVTYFADNFEGTGSTPATLTPPWQMAKNVYFANGDYKGGYYPGVPFGPNAIVTGQSGSNQGTYVGKIYPDFDYRPDWANNQFVETVLLFNRTLTSADIAAGQIQMDFDYKVENVSNPTLIYSFVKLLSPNYNDTWWSSNQTLNSTDWSSGSRVIGLGDPGALGAQVQFGFGVKSQNDSSGVLFFDNVTISNVPEPSTVSLLGFGVAGLIATRLRRRS